MRSFGLLLAALSAIAGCSILYGPSTDEFTGGTRDGGGSSASGGGTSGALPDGAPSAEDGGASSSSGRDASSSSGTTGFACAGSLVCDDFEGAKVDTPPLVAKGTELKLVAGGQSSAQALSSTFKGGNASWLQGFLGAQPHVELSFWFRVDSAPPSDPSIHFRIVDLLFGDGCDWELSWQAWIQKDGLHSGTDTYDKDVNPSCGPVANKGQALLTAAELFDGRWHHLVVDADSRGKVRKAVMTLDSLPSVTDEVQSNTGKSSTSLQLDLGISCVQEGSGCYDWQGDPYTVYVDQVTLTAK